MKIQIKEFVAISLIILFSCVASSCHKKTDDRPTVSPPVKVKILTIGTFSQTKTEREYSGIISASESTSVSFSVGGTISELYVKEGQKVGKGQLLGKVKNGDYLNAYNIAQAQLAEAQDGYQRLKKLHDANALPAVKWVEMEQKLKQAENAAEMAKRTLDDANLYSPVAGTVTKKYADVGQTVIPVEPVYEIISSDDLTIDVSVSENAIGSFSTGQKARVQLDAFEGEELEGKVIQKTVESDPLTRSFTVKVSIPNKNGKILPGMLGSVYFYKDSGKGTSDNNEDSETATIDKTAATQVTLPSQAVLLNADNRWFVWVVTDSLAERRFVTVDNLIANGVEITSGLRDGDKVIIEGMQKVGSGTKVTTIE